MSDELSFEVSFHGPFLVATGDASSGVDAAPDRSDLLPATTLKGVMRSSCEDLVEVMGLPADWVVEVFGGPAAPSPWSWSSAQVFGTELLPRARVRIDETTGTADDGSLQLAEEVWATAASFTVVRSGFVEATALPRHVALLSLAGAGVHGLGSDRRRGRGWVSVTPDRPVAESLAIVKGEVNS
jgi:CRISPR/Cas system CSM-associated protein Csm3 (group 7 of RAMP superfamily)